MLKRGWPALALLLALAGCTPQQETQADNEAQHAAQNVKQATQNVAQKTEKVLDNSSITTEVKSAMSLSKKLDTSNISVTTQDKVVTLTGTVPSADQKALAEHIAKDTVGPDVKVVDHLQVGASSGK